MPHPVRLALLAPLMLCAALSAQAAGTPAAAPNQPGAAMSARMRELLKTALPHQGSFVGAPAETTPETPPPHPDADPSVIRMPKYVVSDIRTPTAAEAMSPKAITEAAMNRYLGSKDGLDRGFLNRFTLGQIPLIGGIFTLLGLSVSNEDRAMQRYHEDERLRQMNQLPDLSAIMTKTGDPVSGERIRRETGKTFLRK